MSKILSISTDRAPAAIGPYSQAIQDGTHLFISGQLPINPETGTIEAETIEDQTTLVLSHIQSILKKANCTPDQLLRVEIFMIDLSDFPKVNKIYSNFVNKETPPARQTIQVAGLPLKSLIEISCIAKL